MSPSPVESHPSAVDALCKRYQVRRLEVFGSAANGEFDPAHSDLDFMVEFEPCSPSEHYDRYFGLVESLESLFGRRVDLLEADSIRNPYLLRRINESRIRLYAA